MWFGILTPGAHPSRRKPTAEATVFAWTPSDRRKIDGPFAVIHGGLRVVRRQFSEQGLEASRPRCFVCLEPCPVPDIEALDEPEDLGPSTEDRDPGGSKHGDGEPWAGGRGRPARPEELGATDPALLAFVHLADLTGPADTPLDEEVLILLPEVRVVFATPLDAVPTALALFASSTLAPEPSVCEACGCSLPGDVRIRDAYEAREGLVPRPGALARGRARRGGGHGRRRAA